MLDLELKQVSESVNFLINKYFPTAIFKYLLNSTPLCIKECKNFHFLRHHYLLIIPMEWIRGPAIACAEQFVLVR
jgi:hypothetical protein